MNDEMEDLDTLIERRQHLFGMKMDAEKGRAFQIYSESLSFPILLRDLNNDAVKLNLMAIIETLLADVEDEMRTRGMEVPNVDVRLLYADDINDEIIDVAVVTYDLDEAPEEYVDALAAGGFTDLPPSAHVAICRAGDWPGWLLKTVAGSVALPSGTLIGYFVE